MCNIQDVELVINYTFPLTIEEHMARAVGVGSSKAAQDYVHRIGRTGRAGKKGGDPGGGRGRAVTSPCYRGLAICFFCPESKGAQDEKAPKHVQRVQGRVHNPLAGARR